MGPHVVSLLKAGTSVVLDFPANTSMNCTSSTSQTKHASVGSGSRTRPVITPSRQVITSYFVPPTPDEGLKVVVHSGRQKQLTACADFVGKAVTAV
jgi:hypothetical protein